MMILIITVLSVAVIVLGFTTYNLLRKQEKFEDIMVGYLQYLDSISRVIEISDVKLKELDAGESFKSDDEIGFFFKSVLQIQDILNDFNLTRFNDGNQKS